MKQIMLYMFSIISQKKTVKSCVTILSYSEVVGLAGRRCIFNGMNKTGTHITVYWSNIGEIHGGSERQC
jgi:hypothetical protein